MRRTSTSRNARNRASVVLGRMLDVGAISQGEMFQAQREAASAINQSDFYSPDYFLDWAYREALELIEQQGLTNDYVRRSEVDH